MNAVERIKKLSGQRPYDAFVLGGSLVEQVIPVSALPLPGQANVDFEEMFQLPGGSGANVAVFLSRLGRKVRFFDVWGKDDDGEFMSKCLRNEGVEVSQCRWQEKAPTAFMLILTLPNNDWSGIIRIPGEVLPNREDINSEFIRDAAILHIHGFSFRTDESTAAVEKAIRYARSAGTIVSTDACTPLAEREPQRLSHFFHLSDVVFTNQYEASCITGCSEIAESLDYLRSLGPDLAIIKAGSNGAFASFEEEQIHLPAPQVEVVDTIGAGDALVAGTLAGILAGEDVASALSLGVGTASLVIQGHGAQSFHFDLKDVEELVNSLDYSP